MRLLDLIVTHYKEPWWVGKKFFDMLALQRGVDFNDFRVLIVNDGYEFTLDPDLFKYYPFKVDIHNMPHGGVSSARNAGIDNADAKWVCFCDFDDTFAHVLALRDVLNVLPTDAYDMLWSDFISEDKMQGGQTLYHRRGENVVFIHGKFWRLDWLRKTGLKFDTDLVFNEDSAFCGVANNMMDYKRTGHIETALPMYVWCFNENSATTTKENMPKAYIGLYQRNKIMCESYRKLKDYRSFCAMVARTVHDAYHILNLEHLPESLKPWLEDFRQFWIDNKQHFFACPREDMREVAEASRREHEAGAHEAEYRWGLRDELRVNKSISIKDWLHSLEQKGGE